MSVIFRPGLSRINGLLFLFLLVLPVSAQPLVKGYNPDSLDAAAAKRKLEAKQQSSTAPAATQPAKAVAKDSLARADSLDARNAPEKIAAAARAQLEKATGSDNAISVWQVLETIFLILFTYFTFKYFTFFSDILAERWANFRLLIKRSVPVIRIIGWTIIIYFIIAVVLRVPGDSLTTLIASAGIGLTFAAQDILKNIFGGIMIIFDRPFQVGDKIQIGSHYGEVLNIGLRTVRVVTADDNTVSVPNGEIINQPVSNANSGESYCQVVAEFFLPAHIDQHKARDIAYRAAAVSRYLYLNKPIVVLFKNEIHEGRSMLKMRLKAYVLDIRYEFPFASEMTELVLEQFLSKGLVRREELAFAISDTSSLPQK